MTTKLLESQKQAEQANTVAASYAQWLESVQPKIAEREAELYADSRLSLTQKEARAQAILETGGVKVVVDIPAETISRVPLAFRPDEIRLVVYAPSYSQASFWQMRAKLAQVETSTCGLGGPQWRPLCNEAWEDAPDAVMVALARAGLITSRAAWRQLLECQAAYSNRRAYRKAYEAWQDAQKAVIAARTALLAVYDQLPGIEAPDLEQTQTAPIPPALFYTESDLAADALTTLDAITRASLGSRNESESAEVEASLVTNSEGYYLDED